MVYAPIGKDGYRDANGKIYRLSAINRINPKDYLRDVADGTPMYWYVGGDFFSKGYVSKIERTAKYAWKITCISGIGLLDTKMHNGGLYTGETFGTIAGSIIRNTFGYTVSSDVAGTAIYGHLPYDTARNNLHRLLFAVGASILKNNDNTEYKIVYLDSSTTVNIPQSRIASGGNIQYQTPADGAEIIEHAFFETAEDEEIVLFDNTELSATNNTPVIFQDAPIHSLSVTGSLTVSESNCNYAVVSGTGTLTGKKYTHIESSVRVGRGTDNIKRVKDNELVSYANSYNVAKRVLSYYQSARTLSAKLMLENEKLGTFISTYDPFGEPINAFLSRADVIVSTVKGASCQLIEGYQPSSGNNYDNRMLISENQSWVVPSGVERIRVILIGGGNGGQGGYDGEDGKGEFDGSGEEVIDDNRSWNLVGYRYDDGLYGGAGGAAGAPGEQSPVAVYDCNVTPGQSIAITIGQGGAGGSVNGGAGGVGTPSTAVVPSYGTLSSENGVVRSGYSDPMTGELFAYVGADGVAGGDGGGVTDNGWKGENGQSGGSAGNFIGGAGGAGIKDYPQFPGTVIYREITITGSGGGGAAYGGNGGVGASGYWYGGEGGSTLYIYVAAGGNGASAVSQSGIPTYGCGGSGGNGGGGGGNGAGCRYYIQSYNEFRNLIIRNGNNRSLVGVKGLGGNGSAGGRGGDGCVIIFY